MDAPRFDEMSDAAIDRDLQALLADDPSPAFVARVRTQIAAEAATARTWFAAWGPLLVGTATIALMIVTVVGYRGSRERAADHHQPALPTRPFPVGGAAHEIGSLVAGLRGGVLDRSETTSPVAALESAAAAQQTIRRPVATPRAVAAAEPEVLVDPREAAALRAFFARARSGDVELAAIMPLTSTPPPSSHDVHDIYIAPIAFEPVISAVEDKGVRQ